MATVTFELAAAKAAGLNTFDFNIIHSNGDVTPINSDVPKVEWTGAADGQYEASVSSANEHGIYQIDPNMLAFQVSADLVNVAQGDGILVATVTVY